MPETIGSFDEPFVRLTPADAATLVAGVYGLDVVASPRRLHTERDDTFMVEAAQAQRFVLKVAHPADVATVIDLQTQALAHVGGRDAQIPVQSVVPALDGQLAPRAAAGPAEGRIARLLTYLPGTLLRHASPTSDQLSRCGRVQGRVARALEDFDHVGADRVLLFDLRRFGDLREFADLGEMPEVHRAFEWFDTVLAPRADQLPMQVVHGDFSLDNVLVDESDADYVTGVLDWGDVMRTWRAGDLASGLASQIAVDGDPWRSATRWMEGFEDVCPLADAEHELIEGLVMIRIVQRLLTALHLDRTMPGNSEYLLRNVSWSRAQISNLASRRTSARTSNIL